MKRKSKYGMPLTKKRLEEQIEKDAKLFKRLSVNLRKARREELEAVWPETFLPDPDEPQLQLEAT